MALPLYPAMVGYVLANLRPCDAAEVWPVCPYGATPEAMGEFLCNVSPLGGVILHDDIPAAACGVAQQQPGVWSGWMFATDAWPKVWRKVVRLLQHEVKPALIERGAHRVHVHSLVGHPDAGKLLRFLGFHCEAPEMRGFGRQGETYSQWACVRGIA